VLAGLLAAATIAAVVCWVGFRRAEDAAETRPPPTEETADATDLLLTSSRALDALGSERSNAVQQVGGLDVPHARPAGQPHPLRDDTDEAALALRIDVTGRGGRVLREFGPAFDALDQLSGLRDDVDTWTAAEADARAARRTITDPAGIQRATAAYTRYSAVMAEIDDGIVAAVEEIDQPGSEGLVLQATISAQMATATDLDQALLYATMTGLDDSAEVAALSALLADFEAQATTIKAVEPLQYREVVEDAFPEEHHTRLATQTRAALAGEPFTAARPALVERDGVLAVAEEETTYAHLFDRVHQVVMTESQLRGRDRVVGEEDRAGRWKLALGTAVVVAAASLLALMAAIDRARKEREEPHHDLTAILAIPARRPLAPGPDQPRSGPSRRR
jgi:hypothetical protein